MAIAVPGAVAVATCQLGRPRLFAAPRAGHCDSSSAGRPHGGCEPAGHIPSASSSAVAALPLAALGGFLAAHAAAQGGGRAMRRRSGRAGGTARAATAVKEKEAKADAMAEGVPGAQKAATIAEQKEAERAAKAKEIEEKRREKTRQVGICEPLGYWDPLNLCKDANEDTFRYYRAAEIKHGRVAMLASVGLVWQHFENLRFPGFEDCAPGIKAPIDSPSSYGAFVLFCICGVLETLIWQQYDFVEPGNFGDPLGIAEYTVEFRNKEINNGRLAMFTTLGILAAELNTGKDGVEQIFPFLASTTGTSPLTA